MEIYRQHWRTHADLEIGKVQVRTDLENSPCMLLYLSTFSQPLEPCSYLTENFESSCTQVYNYHRLLSWDNTRGLHVDIFKVPTCCSCHLVGYKEAFPPLGQPSNSISSSRKPQHDLDAFSQSSNRNSQYSTLNGSDEEEDVDDDDSNIAYQFGNGFKRLRPKKENQNSNQSVNRRVPIYPETYLTPPSNNNDANFPFSNRGPSRPRTPPLRRKQFDQSYSESDLKTSRVTVFPPKHFSQSDRPRKVTPPITSTIDTNSVNLRLANQNSEHKRINYNYHPIIDFFEDGEKKEPQRGTDDLHRKAGRISFNEPMDDSWRPVVGG